MSRARIPAASVASRSFAVASASAGSMPALRCPVTRGPIASALHALNLLIARQLIGDLQRFAAEVEIRVVPPLCPVARTAYDFSGTEELVDRAAASTRRWLARGGLEEGGVPAELEPHAHPAGPAPA